MSKIKIKKTAIIDKSQCVACGCCERACKKGAITIFYGSYAYCNKDLCVGCGLCQKACPASIIKVEDENE